MERFKRPKRDRSGGSTTLAVVMWVLFLPLLLGAYGDWVLHNYVETMPLWLERFLSLLGPLLAVFYLIPTLVFFAGQTSFLVFWGVGLVLCTLLWVFAQRGRVARAVSSVPLALIALAPLAVPAMYGRYDALEVYEAPPGYELDWLTQPQSFLDGAIRRAQYELDDFHGRCQYRLLGWSGENELYYFTENAPWASCNGGDYWMYDAAGGGRSQSIEGPPDDFESSTGVSPGPEHPSGDTSITGWRGRLVEESVSPDGTMRAAVIQDWSPLHFEVVVLRRTEQ